MHPPGRENVSRLSGSPLAPWFVGSGPFVPERHALPGAAGWFVRVPWYRADPPGFQVMAPTHRSGRMPVLASCGRVIARCRTRVIDFLDAGAWGAQDPAPTPVDALGRPLKAAPRVYQGQKKRPWVRQTGDEPPAAPARRVSSARKRGSAPEPGTRHGSARTNGTWTNKPGAPGRACRTGTKSPNSTDQVAMEGPGPILRTAAPTARTAARSGSALAPGRPAAAGRCGRRGSPPLPCSWRSTRACVRWRR